jgi:hypothetical protein
MVRVPGLEQPSQRIERLRAEFIYDNLARLLAHQSDFHFV